jgi:hypothetical protein
MSADRSMPPPRHAWPHEIELLLACARSEMSAADVSRAAAAIESGIDWDRQVAIANAHRLVPFLSRFLARHQHDAPAHSVEAVHDLAAANTRRSLLFAAELRKLLSRCAAQRIAAVPLKGPVLAQVAYGSVALRQIDDLDILVAVDDVPQVIAMLLADGYVHSVFNPPRIAPLIQRHGTHLSFFSPVTGVKIELHHRLLPGPIRGGDIRWLAPRLVPADFMGIPIQAMAPEDLLAYLCAHGATHAWSRLEWLAAVAALLRAGMIRDWDRVHRCASDLGAWQRVTGALVLARELFDTELALTAVLPPANSRVLRANADVVSVLSSEPERTFATSRERTRYQLLTDPSVGWRVARVWSRAMAPQLTDAEFLPLPRAAWPLYFILRPLRLLAIRVGLLRARNAP